MSDTSAERWVQIKCRSPRCDVPGGRTLYCERVGSLLAVKRRGSGVIVKGVPVLLVCRCGWRWQNPDTTSFLDNVETRLEVAG